MIAETAAGEEGGNKAEWIASALGREAPAFPNLRALVWFDDEDPRADFRVDSSPSALAAFRTAIASPHYAGTRSTLLATPASMPPGSAAPAEPRRRVRRPLVLRGTEAEAPRPLPGARDSDRGCAGGACRGLLSSGFAGPAELARRVPPGQSDELGHIRGAGRPAPRDRGARPLLPRGQRHLA